MLKLADQMNAQKKSQKKKKKKERKRERLQRTTPILSLYAGIFFGGPMTTFGSAIKSKGSPGLVML